MAPTNTPRERLSDNGANSPGAAVPLVAVLGNPNTGKSTLFNALTGSRQRTGNYPGVTVERREGTLTYGQTRMELVDLPGTYSLAPRSPDEMLTVQVLLGSGPASRAPDVILCVVDASNLTRNLFLVSQLLDLQRPLVVALNMTDVARRRGIEVDTTELSKLLGVPVIPIQANRKQGIESLKQALVQAVNCPPVVPHDPFTDQLKDRLTRLDQSCPDDCQLKRFVVTRVLFDTDGYMADRLQSIVGKPLLESARSEQQDLVAASGVTVGEAESRARYNWISAHREQFIRQVPQQRQHPFSHQLDRWLTHPLWGFLIAAAVLFLLFQIVFRAAEPASALIDALKGWLASGVDWLLAPGPLHSLLVNGVIEGVGGVLVFLPQILVLFLILGVLEDSGYLARASFLMDRLLSKIGLSGISLIPLLSSFACAIPGIMSTRVITNYRERLVTILIAPLMSCSARLPVYVLLIAAFVPPVHFLGGLISLQALTMLGLYLLGVVAAIGVAWVLKKFFFRHEPSSFVIELPPYKLPQLGTIWRRMREGGWAFIRDAGTLIVAMTILVWAAAYFPRSEATVPADLKTGLASVAEQLERAESPELQAQLQERQAELEAELDGHYLRQSYLARAGRLLEPAVRPLGWDWRIGSAVLASFPAREVVVSTMGVIFGLGSDTDENSESLRTRLQEARWEGTDRPLFNLPMALGLLVFFALCAQCVSTLAVIKRETNSWRWPLVTFAYMTVLAYLGALLTYQLGSLLF